jgi:hypothetical protein
MRIRVTGERNHRRFKEEGFTVSTQETAAQNEWENNGNAGHLDQLLGPVAAPISESPPNS